MPEIPLGAQQTGNLLRKFCQIQSLQEPRLANDYGEARADKMEL